MAEFALSTLDNPWSPFSRWDDWYEHDYEYNHNLCCKLLARFAKSSPELSEREEHDIIETAIDEIVANDLLDKYVKVTPAHYDSNGRSLFVD